MSWRCESDRAGGRRVKETAIAYSHFDNELAPARWASASALTAGGFDFRRTASAARDVPARAPEAWPDALTPSWRSAWPTEAASARFAGTRPTYSAGAVVRPHQLEGDGPSLSN